MNRIPVILDGDPGHDDAIAWMLAAASPLLDIRAVTSVCGNQTIEKTTYNAMRICTLLGISCPVAMGKPAPLMAPLLVILTLDVPVMAPVVQPAIPPTSAAATMPEPVAACTVPSAGLKYVVPEPLTAPVLLTEPLISPTEYPTMPPTK